MKACMQFALLPLLLVSMTIFSVDAQPGGWVELGSAKVHGRADYDEILVTRHKGDFSALKIRVLNEGIDFDRVVVVYANGRRDEMVIRNFIAAGGETRPLDLRGKERRIRKVIFYYKGNPVTARKGKVVLLGRM